MVINKTKNPLATILKTKTDRQTDNTVIVLSWDNLVFLFSGSGTKVKYKRISGGTPSYRSVSRTGVTTGRTVVARGSVR
jgi:hypothetical protein